MRRRLLRGLGSRSELSDPHRRSSWPGEEGGDVMEQQKVMLLLLLLGMLRGCVTRAAFILVWGSRASRVEWPRSSWFGSVFSSGCGHRCTKEEEEEEMLRAASGPLESGAARLPLRLGSREDWPARGSLVFSPSRAPAPPPTSTRDAHPHVHQMLAARGEEQNLRRMEFAGVTQTNSRESERVRDVAFVKTS